MHYNRIDNDRIESRYTHPTLTLAGLGYAAIGLRVVPIAARSKKPLIERWPQRATSDPDQIVSWFESWPDANIGIMTGGGIVGLDIDPRNGGRRSWKKLVKGRKMPETAHAMTGSGGEHYLFRVNPSVPIASASNFRPGIDVKGEGGMLVVEPSVHPNKREYVWLRTPQQGIADIPGWLLALLPRPKATAPTGPLRPPRCTRTGEEAALMARVIERFPVEPGRRHAAMCRAVGSLIGQQYQPEAVQRVIEGWHGHFFALGSTSTGHEKARREIADCIRSTLGNPNFQRARSTIDHRARLAEVDLNLEQRSAIERGIVRGESLLLPGDEGRHTLPCIRVSKGDQRLCRTHQERTFVEALCVYFTYKAIVLNESPPKATRDQIREVVVDRYGIRLDNRQFERLKKKYISRPGKPATHYELAVQIREGRQGIPSEFFLTGLLDLLMPLEASVERLEQSPGA